MKGIGRSTAKLHTLTAEPPENTNDQGSKVNQTSAAASASETSDQKSAPSCISRIFAATSTRKGGTRRQEDSNLAFALERQTVDS